MWTAKETYAKYRGNVIQLLTRRYLGTQCELLLQDTPGWRLRKGAQAVMGDPLVQETEQRTTVRKRI